MGDCEALSITEIQEDLLAKVQDLIKRMRREEEAKIGTKEKKATAVHKHAKFDIGAELDEVDYEDEEDWDGEWGGGNWEGGEWKEAEEWPADPAEADKHL